MLHRDWCDQLNVELQVVAWHNHLSALRQLNSTGDVSCTEVELWTVVLEEWCVTTAFFLRQDINLTLKLSVWVNRLRLTKNLTTLNALTVNTAKKGADVVACFTAIKQLAEHFNTSTGCCCGVFDTNDFDAVANIDHAALNTTSYNSTAT